MNLLQKNLALASLLVLPFMGTGIASAATPLWDAGGTYDITFNYLSTDYVHEITLAQDGAGALTGNGGFPSGGPLTYTWTLTSGSMSGNAIDFYANYTAPGDATSPLTVMHVNGTVAPDGSMAGTWSDNYQGGARAGTWESPVGSAVSLATDITVVAENFNTNRSTDYYGATVGYVLGGADTIKVASVSVALYDAADNLLVTNTSKSAAKVNNTSQGPQYSSAFIVQPGTYTTSSTWNFGAWTPQIGVVPAKAVITVTDVDGLTYTAQNTSFQASEPSHPTWASLFDGLLTPSLAAEDFGVVNYDTGLGMLKGYTAGFGLTNATFENIQSMVVKLYSGATLLQTNTATALVGVNITGAQISSPFDVSGTFDYITDGYWTNVREVQYGQSVPATRVVATVTLEDGTVVTAENTLLVGDPTTIYPIVVVIPTPTEKNQCKKNGWKSFTDPTFKNQGQCVSYVEHLTKGHDDDEDEDDNDRKEHGSKKNLKFRHNNDR